VPAGEWFCSFCHPRRDNRAKTTRSQAAPPRAACHSHDIRREAREVDEIDGILIEAFADAEDAGFQHGPSSNERHQYQSTSEPQPQSQPQVRSGQRKRSGPRSGKRKRSGPQPGKLSQGRPLRHQLLLSQASRREELGEAPASGSSRTDTK